MSRSESTRGQFHYRDMFTTEGIEVLGTPVGNDLFIQTFVSHFTDGLVHTQLLKFCENTLTEYNEIIGGVRGLWGSFHNWFQQGIDLTTTIATTMLHMSSNNNASSSFLSLTFLTLVDQFLFLILFYISSTSYHSSSVTFFP
jgi:hypothetical protein